MSIRITTIPEPGTTVIKIDGRLTSDDTEELLRIFGQLAGPVALDLSDLRSIDRTFVDRLREFVAGGMQLRAASPYMELLLTKEITT
jgi:hypothetical protein